MEQIISFEPQKARYIRFFSTAALDGTGSSAAEFRVFGGKSELAGCSSSRMTEMQYFLCLCLFIYAFMLGFYLAMALGIW